MKSMDGEEFILFKEEAIKLIQDAISKIEKLEIEFDEKLLYDVYSDVHTIKGEAGFFKLNDVAEALHFVEEEIEKLRRSGKALKENTEDIRKKLLFVNARIKSTRTEEIKDEVDFSEYVKSFFHEYAKCLGKKAELEFRTEIPPGENLMYLMNIAIVLLKNALEHAIETQEERRSKNKKEAGKISLTISFIPPNKVEINYADDGKGFPKNIVSKVNSGNIEDIKGVSSTGDRVSIHSGRGMGLYSIYKIITTRFKDGKITINSETDRGSEIKISFFLR